MKIKAKEVELGMTVSWGVVTMKVEAIIKGLQKNGTETRTFKGPIERNIGRGRNPMKYTSDFTAKNETLLILK
jgi:hypothetical protein